jgi:mono/diheme cytochrome c family protein
MAITIPFDPYDPNPVTQNGATLLTPPEGTVPVGGFRFAYGSSREEATRAGIELFNPFEADRDVLKRGKQVFDTFCIVCHGPEGHGDGPIIGRFPNPPSLLADRARNLLDGTLFHIIARGQGIMAPYAAQVRPNDRWRVILYIRSLQGAK